MAVAHSVSAPSVTAKTSPRHTVSVRSTGADWFRIESFKFTDYAVPTLGVLGRSTGDAACLWIYSRRGLHRPGEKPVAGELTISGLRPGAYAVEWWDTRRGRPILRQQATADRAGRLRLRTPPIARDAAALIRRPAR